MTDNATLAPPKLVLNSTYCFVQQELIENATFQAVCSFFYVAIFLVGMFGNLLVAYVILTNRTMRNPTNLFITNLAFADILMCCLSVPFTPIQSFTGKWLFGRALCTLFPVSQGISVYMSTLTMTIIALDRFVVVCYSHRQRMQVKTSLLFIAIIDAVAILFVLPYGFHIKMIVGYDGDARCNEVWMGWSRTAYGLFTSTTQFALPFVTIILCYSTIIVKLRKRPKERKIMVIRSLQKQELETKRMKRTNRMLMSMVVIFGSTWLPLNAINLVADFDMFNINCFKYYHALFIICHLVAMTSTCCNPFIYGRFNDSFRKEFLATFPLLKVFCGVSDYQLDDPNNLMIELAPINTNGKQSSRV